MSNTNAGFGLKVLGLSGAGVYTGATREYPIASGSATAIYTGDLLKQLTTGYVDKKTADGTTTLPLGVAAGFRWYATDGTLKISPYWPAGTTTLNSQDAVAVVVDDPNVELVGQFGNSTSVPALADIGSLFDIYIPGTAGNTTSGLSASVVDYSSTGQTASKSLKFVRFLADPSNDTTSAYSRGVFRFATHFYLTTTATGI